MFERRREAFEEWFSRYGVLTSQSKYTLALSETRDKLAYYASNPIGGGAQNINASVYPEHSVYEFDDPIRLRNLFDDCTKQNVRDDGAMHTAVGWYAMWLRLKAPDQWKDVEEWPNDNERKKTMKNRGYDYDAVLGQRLSSNGHSANTHIDSAYLAAIRTKPFILLAGISGTGKSRMVRQLARGCCPRHKEGSTTEDHPLYNEQKPGNFEMIPVRPNWHDSTELMGYVTRISSDNKPKYVLTPFVHFLVKAWLHPDVPFFLCLDEMNLAPVEQYFAEYLSAIESRKKDSSGKINTDVLVRFDVAQIDDDTNKFVKATVDALLKDYKPAAGSPVDAVVTDLERKMIEDKGLRIPPNLVVMGTVNMDETTCTFSRKVLDRAMSFELNDVSDMYAPDKLVGEGDYEFESIDADAAKGTLLTGKEAYDSAGGQGVAITAASGNTKVGDAVLAFLENLNEKEMPAKKADGSDGEGNMSLLAKTPFKIAYRSRNEIMVYCIERIAGNIVPLPQALDEALSMKVLSRIEGDSQHVRPEWLQTLSAAIVDGLSKLDGYDADKCVVCKDKLADMVEQAQYGYTSFWMR